MQSQFSYHVANLHRQYVPYIKHLLLKLSLSLLMFWVFANNHYATLTLNNLALFTNRFNRRFNFHCVMPLSYYCQKPCFDYLKR